MKNNRFQSSNHNQKKVVQVFRTFFQKIVLPTIKNETRIMYQWKYLISMMCQEPIELEKLDLYMKVLNHQTATPNGFKDQPHGNTGQRIPNNNLDDQDYGGYREVKDSRQELKKKMLGALQGFHNSLLQNQQKLQNNFKGGRNIKQPQQRRYL